MKHVLALVLALTATAAAAEELTLDQAVASALANNPGVQAATFAAEAAAEAVGTARAAYFPTVTADARAAQWQAHAFLPKGIPIAANTIETDDYSAGVDVRYLLFDSGRRSADVAAARAMADGAGAEADRARLETVFAVHRTYFALEAAEAALSAARARAERAEAHVALAQTRKDAGAVASIDVVRARVEVANARGSLARAEANRAIAAGALNTLMGAEVAAPVTLKGSVGPRAIPSLEEALRVAEAQRPEVAAARHRAEASRNLVDVARSAYGPKVSVQGGYGWRDDDFLPEDEEWSIGVGIDYEIFTGYARRHRVARARSEEKRDRAQLSDAEQRVRQEVWSALQDAEHAGVSLDAAEAAKREAEEALRLARARYEAGAGTINDLLDAESALLQADAVRITALFERERTESAVLRATGSLLPQTSPE
ncbi:MAG: TolC family protein [Thermoanaerobaculia bacterium]